MFLTRREALVVQAAHVIEALVLHVLWYNTHNIRYCGIGVLQPRHQPFCTTVALEAVASQVPAEEEHCMSFHRTTGDTLEVM